MIKAAAMKMTSLALQFNVISRSEQERYIYSYEVTIEKCISWGSVLLLSLIFGCFWETAIFITFFIPLRKWAGGFHAKQFYTCYSISIITYLAFALTAEHLAPVAHAGVVTALVSAAAILIFLLAPVPHPNNPLTPDEHSSNRKKMHRILVIEYILCLLLVCWQPSIPSPALYLYVCYAIIQVAVILLIPVSK